MSDDDRPGTERPDSTPDGARDRAPASKVETVIVEENGQWAVDIVVTFPDEVIRKRISTYRTLRLAAISADLIRRAAERNVDGPRYGMG